MRDVAERLGYAPNALARMLITQKSMTVGLLQPALSSSFAGQVLDGVEDAAQELGYSVLICSTGSHSSASSTGSTAERPTASSAQSSSNPPGSPIDSITESTSR